MTVDVHFPDLTPPVSTITGFPAKLSGKSSGSFSFSANESADFACRMDAGDFFPCTTPFVFAGLADGSHNFSVRATDLAGNEETTPASYDWTVDTTAPPCNIRNGTACFETFSEAYAAILPGSRTVIKLRQLVFGEEFNMNRQVDVRLEGGYDSSFTGRSGSTVFVGKVTVSAGSVAMDEISLRVAGRSLP
jgi:hypothetical protein